MGARVKFCTTVAGSLWLLVASCLIAKSVQGASFVVKVSPSRIAQVEARYTFKGFIIRERNVRRRYLVVALPGDRVISSPVPTASPAPEADASVVDDDYPPAADAFGNLKSSPGGEEPWLGQQLSSSSSSSSSSSEPVHIPPMFSWQRSPTSQQGAADVTSAITTGIDMVKQVGGEGVERVDVSPVARLLRGRSPQQRQWRQQQQQQQQQNKRHLQQALAQATAAGSCPVPNSPDGAGWQLGNVTEVTPYAVKLAEADLQEVIELSKNNSQKVLFCVIDTGLDATNGEFDPRSTSGCIPNTTRPDGSQHLCEWAYDDILPNATGSHGTHVSGTIAARRNGRGLVGIAAEGAQLYHYNIFGPREEFELIESIRAWDDCIAELEYRRKTLETPDMKLVISMSWGSQDDLDEAAKYLNETAQNRADILFVAAAGNYYNQQLVYPAASPAVVSVAAVDWNGLRADFSTYNADVEWAAGGVNIVSTLPRWVSSSRFVTDASITLSQFKPPADNPDILINPRVLAMGGTGLGSTSGQLADCGFAAGICPNATGKICLIQRGGALFCSKMWNCINGGGIAAVVYGRDDQPECEQVSAVTLVSDACAAPVGGWPVTLTATRKQGLFLKQAVLENPAITATLFSGQGDYALGAMSGTSMAAPAAAGVAGVVWSSHSNCTADQVRAAISASAQDKGPAGRDPHYGLGIVKALAAHRYLLDNPCAARHLDTSKDCLGGWGNWTACRSGFQYSSFTVMQPAVGSGQPCEAKHGAVRNKTCGTVPEAVNDAVVAVANRWEYLDVVRNDIGLVVSISLPSPRSENGAQLKLQLSPERSNARSKSPKAASDNLVAYLSKPGFTGLDSFNYTVADAQGRKSIGQVSVNVTAGSCATHACTLGRCSTRSGLCRCQAAAGMFNSWVLNPVLADRARTPKVPACLFREFAALPPFRLAGSRASRGKSVALDFRISPAAAGKCFSLAVNPVANVTFWLQSPAPGQAAPCPDGQAVQGLTDSSAAPGSVTCSGGRYRYTVQAPQAKGCYRLRLQLADLTVQTAQVWVV